MLFLPEPEPEPSLPPPLMKNCINEVNTKNYFFLKRKDLKKNVDSKHYVQNQRQTSSRNNTLKLTRSIMRVTKIDSFNHAC